MQAKMHKHTHTHTHTHTRSKLLIRPLSLPFTRPRIHYDYTRSLNTCCQPFFMYTATGCPGSLRFKPSPPL